MVHTPSLGVYTDKQLIDELHIRLDRGAIRIELKGTGEGWANLLVCGDGRDGRYGFEAVAYEPPIAHI